MEFRIGNFALATAALLLSCTSASAGLKVDYSHGTDPNVRFKTQWVRLDFVKAVDKYLQTHSVDQLASKLARLVPAGAGYDPYSGKTWVDAKYGSDLKLTFNDQKNIFTVKFHGDRLYRFNGPDDANPPVPGPEAGAGLAGLAMAGFGAYALGRRRNSAALE